MGSDDSARFIAFFVHLAVAARLMNDEGASSCSPATFTPGFAFWD